MNILYIANHRFSNKDGVSKKIIEQITIWEKYGHKTILVTFQKTEKDFILPENITFINVYRKNILKNIFFTNKYLLKKILNHKIDMVYLRYGLWLKSYDYLLRNFKTVVEIQTDDINELLILSKKSILNKMKYIYVKVFRNRILSKASLFITVTKELSLLKSYTKFNKPIACIPNGINLLKYNIIKQSNKLGKKIKLFFLGSADFPWHGIDIIEKIANNLSEFEFHIVGDYDKKNYNKNVIYHGKLTKDEYEKILKECNVCIGSMALFRNKMKEACPLKVREYLAYGFPVILGYKDTSFLQKDADFILEIDFSEEIIDNKKIKEIKEFVEKNKNRIVKREEILQLDINELEKQRLAILNKI